MKKGIIALALGFGFTYAQAQEDSKAYNFCPGADANQQQKEMKGDLGAADDTQGEFSFEGEQYQDVIAPEGKNYVCVKEAPDSLTEDQGLQFEGEEKTESKSQNELQFEQPDEPQAQASQEQGQDPEVLIEESQETNITIEEGEASDVQITEDQAKLDKEQKSEEEGLYFEETQTEEPQSNIQTQESQDMIQPQESQDEDNDVFFDGDNEEGTSEMNGAQEDDEGVFFDGDNDEGTSKAGQNQYQGEAALDTTNQTYTYTTEEDESTLENVVEAPFKYVGTVVGDVVEGAGHIVYAPVKGAAYVVKGAAEVVGEVGEGVGHIVYSPIKGFVNLFDGDNDENTEAADTETAQAQNEQDMFVDTETEATENESVEGGSYITPENDLDTDSEYYDDRLFDENLDVSEDEFIIEGDENEVEVYEYEGIDKNAEETNNQ